MSSIDPAAALTALAAPFDPSEVKFKPGAVSGNRALAMPYVDARTVMDRLDSVVGATGWQDEYQFLPDGSAICRLQLRIGGEWIVKADVGGQSEQPDEGDRHKAAVSDALKRAAVKWGVGRYLYRLPQQWCDFDPQKRRFTQQPKVPGSAAPPNGKPANPPPEKKPEDRSAPTTTAELADRLRSFGARLVAAGLCENVNDLLAFVRGQLGTGRVPLHDDPASWPAHVIGQAMREAKAFEAKRRQPVARNGTKV